ncbi:MAG: phosphotransferase family protein, partial [Actinobacteria bacterium]|nr:phosphotransferase family protein [Actinomycetota bacterium]
MSTVEAAPVRPGDDFDVAAVHAWLAERIPEAGRADAPPEVRQFSGGASNLTYLLRYPERELILRRPPVGHKAASAHDMQREFRVQSLLAGAYPYVPEMLALCDDHDVLGADFYVMERLDGVILRGRPPRDLDLSPERTRALCTSVIDRLVDLHQVDPEATGLDELGRGTGYVERQVAGWSARYRAARTTFSPRFERVMAWLEAHRPDDVANVVIHNDYRFDNVVLDPVDLSVVGVLDWEMATLGDPLMDLGASLAYWVEADDDRVMQA